MKTRLLFVVEAMGGGVFSYIVDLSNKLVNDYDVYIAYGIRPQTPKDYKNYFDNRVRLIEVNNFTRSISLVKDSKAFLELKRIEKQVKPDIIHLHSSKAGVLGRVAFMFKNKPVFYTPHGFSFLMADISPVKRSIYRLIEKLCSLGGATTIACSPGEFAQALRLSKKVKLVNNGINTDDLSLPSNSSSKKIEVVTVGRATYQKNPVFFNKVAKLMPNVNFTWIGDGELVNELNAQNITITGWLSREEVIKQLQVGNIFVLTSLWEGLPISLLEAMYLEKICIVTDVVGNNDVIKNGVNGFICRTPEEFKQVIQSVIDGEIDIEKITGNAKKDIIKKYNTSAMAEGYKKIYKKALK